MASFDEAVDITLRFEGGYVNNPHDPGGETNFGICKRDHPDLDIKNLTRAQAKQIYFSEYWREAPINNNRLADKIFDLAVRCGKPTAYILLQRAIVGCGKPITIDAAFGPETATAANSIDSHILLKALIREAGDHDKRLAADNCALAGFLKGWLARDAEGEPS